MPPTIKRIRSHSGPNLHANGPCVTLAVDWPGRQPAADRARLAAILDHPKLAKHRPASLPETLDPVACLAVLLQQALGHPVSLPDERPWPGGRIVVPVWDADVGVMAARFAVEILGRADPAPGENADSIREAKELVGTFFDRVKRLEHSDCVMRILPAATRRDVPWSRLVPGGAMIRLGQGARQKVIDGSATPGVGTNPSKISTHKDLATALMRRHGLPVPRNRRCATVGEAVRAAAEIGYPVVVKPNATDLGTGITLDIKDEATLRRAYAIAARYGRVLVEQQLDGYNTRLLVFFGRFVSAVRKNPAQVIGDGRRSVEALIHAANEARSGALKPIDIDDEAHWFLARQGLSIDAVPAAGREIVLRHVSNFARGGSAHCVTDLVHPDNARLAERAAEVVGLEIAGVDLIMPDIARSWREVGGGICELNAGPGIFHGEPDTKVEDAFLGGLYPAGTAARVPIVCVLGNDDRASADLVARIAGQLGDRGIGVVTPSGARVGPWPVADRQVRSHDATQIVIGDPGTRAAIVHLTPAFVAEDGLAFDRCDLAIVPASAEGGDVARLLIAAAGERVDPQRPDLLRAALDRIAGRMPAAA